jgi:radical SAM protein
VTGRPAALSDAAGSARAERDAWLAALDYDRAPFTIAWELTRACAYACKHCRATAQPRRHPHELTTAEAERLIDQLAGFGTRPILVLTGGDPLMRRDVFDLAGRATEHGLRVSLTPTATALPTRERMDRAREAGIRRVAFSLDAADPVVHDRFRGFRGSFERTMQAMDNAREAGLALQVNTTVCTLNRAELEPLAERLAAWDVVQWSVFFLVPTGRGRRLQMISPQEHERVLTWLDELRESAPYDVKATAAPQSRRIAMQRAQAAGRPGAAPAGAGFRFADGLDRPVRGVNDGRGFMFVSHRGEVTPSGFLPLEAGNVRRRDPVEIYRDAPLFRDLRDPAKLKGKCGRCEFNEVCGGSRARAYAVTGDPLAPDPSCPYRPRTARAATAGASA